MDKKYWIELTERYFDAETTEREELALKRFLVSGDASDPCFDEARAVMGLFAAAKASRRKRSAAVKWTSASIAAVAAAALIVFGLIFNGSDCMMWEDGVRITDRQEIIASAEDALFDIFSSGTDAEEELGNLFETY